jgi:hypothetical protein
MEIFIIVEAAAASMFTPLVLMEPVSHPRHEIRELERERGIERERRRRAVMRIGSRFIAFGPEAMDHQRSLDRGPALGLARMSVGAEAECTVSAIR